MTITSSGQWGTAQRCADSSGQRCLPPPGPIVGRLVRTQANFLETLPIAILALISVVVDGRTKPVGSAWWLDLARCAGGLSAALLRWCAQGPNLGVFCEPDWPRHGHPTIAAGLIAKA